MELESKTSLERLEATIGRILFIFSLIPIAVFRLGVDQEALNVAHLMKLTHPENIEHQMHRLAFSASPKDSREGT